jgi:tRNA (guanine37-N1)-methyltransferase
VTTLLRFTALTLFPEMFHTIKEEGVISRAIKNGIINIDTVYLRDFSDHPRKNVDGSPVSGGDGMIIRPDIAERALLSVKTEESYVINLTPSGKTFDSQIAKTLAQKKHLIFICGRYGGYDYRFSEKYSDIHISIGDFVVSGGELPAMCAIDSVARFVPGVLGNSQSATSDSFEDGLLEAPQYTHPETFQGTKIPPILFSGNHKKITEYNRKEQLKITAKYRPDLILLLWDSLNKQERALVQKIWKNGY